MTQHMESLEAKIEFSPPQRFTARAMIGLSAYSLLLIVPVVASVLVMSLMRFTVWSALLPLLAIAATGCFLPLGLGNAYITRLVRSLYREAVAQPRSFVVQVTVSPRAREGLWAIIEDADDVGCLRLTDGGLVYSGDMVKLTVPFGKVRDIFVENIGLRGLFLYGRIVLRVSGLPNVQAIAVAERSSWLLHRSRAQTRALYRCLVEARENAMQAD